MFTLPDNELYGWEQLLGVVVYHYAKHDETRRKAAGVPEHLTWFALSRDEQLTCCRSVIAEYGGAYVPETVLEDTELATRVLANIADWIDMEIESKTKR